MTYFIEFILLVSIAITIYLLIDLRSLNKTKKYFNSILNESNKKFKNRLEEKKNRAIQEGQFEDKKFFSKLDNLIEYSGIRQKIPYMTTELFIILSAIFSIIITLAFKNYIYDLIIFNIIVLAASFIAPFLILSTMSRYIYDIVDDKLLVSINIWVNLCTTNTDIVQIFSKSLNYLAHPLKDHIENFVFECNKGVPEKQAFLNLENKIENFRIKQLIRNLSIASQHSKNYKAVLVAYKDIMQNYYSTKMRVKKEVKTGRIGIVLVIVIGMFLFKTSVSIANNDYSVLIGSLAGNIILLVNLAILLFAIYSMITLDKIGRS